MPIYGFYENYPVIQGQKICRNERADYFREKRFVLCPLP